MCTEGRSQEALTWEGVNQVEESKRLEKLQEWVSGKDLSWPDRSYLSMGRTDESVINLMTMKPVHSKK